MGQSQKCVELLGHGTLKAPVYQAWIDELRWFFTCW